MKPRHPPRNQTTSARNKLETNNNYDSTTKKTSDKRFQPSRRYYVQKMSHNNYHIPPLIGDDATCTTDDCTQNETQTNSKQKQETKTQPTSERDNHSTKATPDNHKKNLTKKARDTRPFSATLQLDKRNKIIYVPLQFREYENYRLLDTGAFHSASSENELRRILKAHPAVQL